MLLTSQNHSTNLIYHLHGPKKRAPPELGQKSKITNICVGVYQKFFSPTFLDVFLDVESDKKKPIKVLTIRGRDIAVFLILTSHRAIFLSQFFKKSKKSFKSPWNMAYFVPNFLLIIFMKSILVHLVPPTHRIAKTAENSAKIALLGTQISRDWDRNRKIGSNSDIRLSF